MEKQGREFKDSDPWDYKAGEGEISLIDLPPRLFCWIEGEGDPNGNAFAQATGALYGFSYAVRMNYKAAEPVPSAYAYTVGVLQGRWSLKPGEVSYDADRKECLAWAIMIRQPEFLSPALFERFREEAKAKAIKKKEIDAAFFDCLRYGERDGGRYAQILHIGPFDEEPESFARLEHGLSKAGLKRQGKHHWELYHSDPRKSAPEKLRTILRVEVE